MPEWAIAFVHRLWYLFLMTEITWTLPLASPPRLRYLSFGIHGDVPRERYRLRGLWCLHLYRYAGEARIAGHLFPIRTGSASVTPPDTDLEHHWLHPGSVHLSAHFALEDQAGECVPVPAMQALEGLGERIYAEMTEAVSVFPAQPHRAEATLWRVLWQLSDTESLRETRTPMHPGVRQTIQTIEAHLGEPLSVLALARACGLSHNHLTRSFRAAMGDTVVGYIGKRRMERARHLLTHSTLPVKTVALQVGIPDLQLFNKSVRHTWGHSPRTLRSRGPAPE